MRRFNSPAYMAASVILPLVGCTDKHDDPAVAVCETILKASVSGSDENYKRTTAKINGVDVQIFYQIGHLNTEPKAREWTCSFEDIGGKFILSAPASDGAEACTARIDAISEEVKKIPSGMKARIKLVDEAKACAAVIQEDAATRMELIARATSILSPLGIYPILKEDTALSGSGQ